MAPPGAGNRRGVHLRNGNNRQPVADNHVGATAKEVAEHASALTRLELELATLELKRKATELALGSAMAAAAALLGVFALAFLFAAAAAGLAEVLPWWGALLIVTGVLLAIAAILAFIAVGRFRNATPPVPERAIREAQLTREAIGR